MFTNFSLLSTKILKPVINPSTVGCFTSDLLLLFCKQFKRINFSNSILDRLNMI